MVKIFRNSVHFQFRTMHPHNWMMAGNRVVVFPCPFLFKNWPLSNRDADFWLSTSWFNRHCIICMFLPPLLHESNKIYIAWISSSDVSLFFFCSFQFALWEKNTLRREWRILSWRICSQFFQCNTHLLHETSAFLSFCLHAFDALSSLILCTYRYLFERNDVGIDGEIDVWGRVL